MIQRKLTDMSGNDVTVDGRTDDFTDGTDDQFEQQQPDNDGADSPDTTAGAANPDDEITEQEKIGFAVMAIILGFAMFGFYQCYVCYRRRQQRRMMEYVNTRADSVLGDMVMIPTSFDEDNEDDEMEGELI